jgi:hypothetical protein
MIDWPLVLAIAIGAALAGVASVLLVAVLA